MTEPGASALGRTRRATFNDWSSQLARWALAQPDKVVLRHAGTTRTYAELDHRASCIAGVLAEYGVKAGDRVAVLSGNRLEVIDLYFGVMRLGAIAVPLNTRLHTEEIRYQLQDSGARAAIGERDVLGLRADAFDGVEAVFVMSDEVLPGRPDRTWVDLEAAVARAHPHPATGIDEQSPAFIMYTSGTTGRPKGAVLSHQNLVMRTWSGLVGMGLGRSDEVWYSGLPLFHIGGWTGILMYLFLGGSAIVAPTGDFDPGAILREIEENAVTAAFFVPTQWQALCAAVRERGKTIPLRRLVWGASPAPLATLEAMAGAFPGVPAISAFGQTETCASTCMLGGDDSVRKMGSVGRPLPGVAVRIVDDEMNDVRIGDVGEIVYQGPTVFLGYWGNPRETEDAMAGGWFHSGDLCRQDDEGFIWVVDRKKDMIVSGGENIYCAEVESVLSTHPEIAEAAVIGVPHPRWVETPCAVVTPTDRGNPPSEKDVIAFVASRLASYKKPTSIRIADALPRNASGKILKDELRKRYAGG